MVGKGFFVKKTEVIGSLPAPFYELGGAFRGVRCRLTDGKKACFRVKNRPFLPILSGFPGFSEGAILQASERQMITKSGITSVFCSHSPVADFRKSYEHRFVNIYTPCAHSRYSVPSAKH